MSDVRYALRAFARSPLFAITAILSIAIGIGADTTVFSIANALLLRPLAGVTDPDRLVDISRTGRERFGVHEISFPNFLDIRQRATTLEDVYGYEAVAQPMSLAGTGGAQRIFGHTVTTNYFSVLGVRAAAGRLFESADAETAVVISHSFWTRRFNRDPSVIGQTLQINSQPRMVVGVASDGFQGTSLLTTDMWIPVSLTPLPASFLTKRELFWGLVRGRLKPGVSTAQAAAEINALGRALEQEYPAENREQGLRLAAASLIPGNLAIPLAGFLTLLLGFVSFVLFIACANVAGLLLARATDRRRETAVRLAIGAGRARLVRQWLTETLLLFALGGAAGLLLARGLTSLIVSLLPALPVPLDVTLALDVRVLAFTAALSLVSALVAGLTPALQASKADVVSALKESAPVSSGHSRTRHAFVVAQVALTIVLVTGAGLFGRALHRASVADFGYDARGVEVAELDFSLAGYTQASAPAAATALLDRVRTIPGVQHATMAAVIPGGRRLRFGRLGHPAAGAEGRGSFVEADHNAVAPGYFATLGVPLVAGRDFNDSDGPTAPRVVIVSEDAARRFWPGQGPLGQVLLLHPAVFIRGQDNDPRMLQVIGVVRDVKSRLTDASRPQVYFPLQQQFVFGVSVLAKTSGARVASEIRGAVGSLDRNLPVLSSQTLQEAGAVDLLPQRMAGTVAASLGIVGLLLAALGIYGVTAYAVSHRTREIGIRMALGADRATIVGMILGVGMRLVAVGSAIGLALAVALSLALGSVFFGFPRMDALAFGGAAALFAATGLIACYVPVRRATSIDAMEALRYE